MTTASVAGTIIAQSSDTVVVEGNHYFPPDSIRWEHLSPTQQTSACPWKGTASYYDISVEGTELSNVAWTYHEPKEAAAEIKDHVAFYPTVTVSN
jgi:uncharacterized protein (DUF427 family)